MLSTLASLLLLFPAVQGGTPGGYQVLVENVSGDELCSVRAHNASVHDLIAEIAKQAGRSLDGIELTGADQKVSARLDARPLDQALHYVLGCVGFRAEVTSRSIYVRPELPPFPTEEDLLDAADLAYQRTLGFHPTSSRGDRAELALARIKHRLDQPALAVGHYDVLIDNYPNPTFMEVALWEAGELLKNERDWDAAAVKYRGLIELEREDLDFESVLRENVHAIEARLNLARCSAQLGNYDHAIYGLNDLDNLSPPTTPEERGRRNFVRARALIQRGDNIEALRLLQRADTRRSAGDHPGERIELLALALTREGRTSDASLAWLEYSQSAEGDAQVDALRNAADLAIQAGDHLGALMICRQAQREGHGRALAALENRARAELDFVEDDLIQVGFRQRIDRGSELVANGELHAGYVELHRIVGRISDMSSDELATYTLAYGRALESEDGIDACVRFLREALPLQSELEHRKDAYRLAATLFEQNDMFDRAIDALGGKL